MIDLDKTDFNKIDNDLKPEVLLKFDPVTEMGKIDIKINRNETLAKKRNDIYNTLPPKDKPKYNNIIFLYIDAISHHEFIRAMKNTEKFLSKYYNSSEQSFYQMMKYQNYIFFTQQYQSNVLRRIQVQFKRYKYFKTY